MFRMSRGDLNDYSTRLCTFPSEMSGLIANCTRATALVNIEMTWNCEMSYIPENDEYPEYPIPWPLARK